MMNSSFETIAVGLLRLTKTFGDSATAETKRTAATTLTAASKSPLRVVVRNISFAAEVWMAFDAATLQTNEPGGNCYFLPAGAADTIVLAPGQRLYAISLSTGAKVSLAISEALPADIKA